MSDSLPLSPTQGGMLYHALAHPGAGVDIEQIICSMSEVVDVALLTSCWRQLPARHTVLRTRFSWQGRDEMRQLVEDRVDLPVDVVDLSATVAGERAARFEAWLAEDRAAGFDPGKAPLSRVTIVRFEAGYARVVWTFHHLLLDGRSFAPVLDEVFADYDARRAGRVWSAPPRPAYAEYLEWTTRQDWEPSLEFWRRELEGFRAPTPLLTETGGSIDPRRVGPLARHVRVLDAAQTAAIAACAQSLGVSANNFVQGAWAALLARYAGTTDVVFGVVRACRRSNIPRADEAVGVFMNTLPLRVQVRREAPTAELLHALRAQQDACRAHENTPLLLIQQRAGLRAGDALFKSVLVFDNRLLGAELRRRGQPASRDFELREKTGFPVAVYAYLDDELTLQLAYDQEQIDGAVAADALDGLATLLVAMARDPQRAIGDQPVLGDAARQRVLCDWNATGRSYDAGRGLHEPFLERAAELPDAIAVTRGRERLTYAGLADRSAAVARGLRAAGVRPGAVVGLCTSRSPELVVGVLGILRAGAAYLPLDPDYPEQRLAYMVEDAAVGFVLADASARSRVPAGRARVLSIEELALTGAPPAVAVNGEPLAGGAAEDLAYLMYTSGSTGRPKGVMVTHRNVQNFFAGMDDRIGARERGVWLAVTSLSFDISVLELLWTLARGFEVVLWGGIAPAADAQPEFSLFYFASDAGENPLDKYGLLMAGARFADEHGFCAVWTPERHFHAFGGLYPNPAVVGAALAVATTRVQIRAGSVVIPLHHPLRVAEEWSVVDNLSRGRVGISIASGWHPNDFVLVPDRYAGRKEAMLADIETIRKLWRGEPVPFRNPKGESVPTSILPRPIQPELPVWVTAAGNPDTFRQAGEIGANLLTHLLGQSVEDLQEKIGIYREARRAAGHPGSGSVALMLHTFVGDDVASVKATVREPMRNYLRSAVDLIKQHASAWSATAKPLDGKAGAGIGNLDELPKADLEALLDFSFDRYFESSALFGTPESCMAMVERVRAVGVDEIACLIDFGVPATQVLGSLPQLERLRQLAAAGRRAPAEAGVGELIRRHGITHLQCTPSMARMLVADADAAGALAQLRVMLVGGEPLPPQLAEQLLASGVGALHNMYGPTETTIWSSTARVVDADVTIGRPLANTQLYVLDDRLQPVPLGAVGELFIGGDGVARGYLNRAELTAERFLHDPFRPGGRMYRTGDLVRFRRDGALQILGRADQQVKVRGHRIELGEIERQLERCAGVRQAVVVVRHAGSADAVLVGHVVRDGSGREVARDELLRELRATLPEAMVPAAIRFHAALPVTPNGKVDRKALGNDQGAPPAGAAPPARAGEPDRPAAAVPPLAAAATAPLPAGDDAAAILAIWREVLDADQVGADDNFFDLGGHSLLTIRLQSQLQAQFAVAVPLVDLFRFTTARAQAELVRKLRGDARPAAADAVSRGADRAAKRRQILQQRRV